MDDLASHVDAALETRIAALRPDLDRMDLPACILDGQLRYRYVNPAYLAHFGRRSVASFVGKSADEAFSIVPTDGRRAQLRRALEGHTVVFDRATLEGPNAGRWVRAHYLPVHDGDEVIGVLVISVDIQHLKDVERDLRRANAALSAHIDNTPLAVIELDTETRFVRWSGQAEAIFGWSAAEMLGRSLSDCRFVYEEDLDPVARQARRLVDGTDAHATLVSRNYRKDGSVIWVEWHHSALRDEEGRAISLLSLGQDVSSRMRAEEKLVHMATHDGLTGLPNRVVLNERLSAALARARRRGSNAAVMFLDLDRFKDVNDTLGHRVGDILLKELSRRLRAALRESDMVARISGDEFVMLLEDLPRDEAPDRAAAKVLDEARRPFAIEGHEIHVSASLGVALFPGDADDAETLLKNADAAMYAAKELGRNSFRMYSPDLAARRARRIETQAALRRALTQRELVLHYQPVVELAGGAVTRVEALLRWNHPQEGLRLPGSFLPFAEAAGLGRELGAWVLEEAARQARAWREAGLGPVVVSVNLSPCQLRDSAMLPALKRTLAATGCEPGWLEFELGESSMVSDLDGVGATLGKLRELGARVAIDDFGTGFSSLSHLRHLPVDVLKIDKSFVADIEASPTGRPKAGTGGAAIVAAILGLARGLGLEVIAEGIEKKSQLAFLARSGCLSGQGYLLCPPLPAAALEEWLRNKQQ